MGAGQFQYRPTGSPWTFAGGAGISGNNSGFTSGNPPAPEGAQVAFLQGTGSFSQAVAGWAAGSYVLTFYAAQRGNYQASRQDFSVLVDGVVVGTFTPSGTSYQSLHHRRVHRHRRVAHDHVPGPGHRRRRQHRLRRRHTDRGDLTVIGSFLGPCDKETQTKQGRPVKKSPEPRSLREGGGGIRQCPDGLEPGSADLVPPPGPPLPVCESRRAIVEHEVEIRGSSPELVSTQRWTTTSASVPACPLTPPR